MDKVFMKKVTDYISREIGIQIDVELRDRIPGVSKLTSGTMEFYYGTGDFECWFATEREGRPMTPGRISSIIRKVTESMTEKRPVIYVMEKGNSYEYQRAFHNRKLNLIVLDHMIQCPDMFTIKKTVRDTFYSRRIVSGRITPFSQVLLIRHILYGDVDMLDCERTAERFGVCKSVVQRAFRWLVENGFCSRTGKCIQFWKPDEAFRRAAVGRMENPVKMVCCLNKRPDESVICGDNAMEKYTMLAGSREVEYACTEKDAKGQEYVPDGCGVTVSIWKYSPEMTCCKGVVDPISLWLSMRNVRDERVEMECDKLFDSFIKG